MVIVRIGTPLLAREFVTPCPPPAAIMPGLLASGTLPRGRQAAEAIIGKPVPAAEIAQRVVEATALITGLSC